MKVDQPEITKIEEKEESIDIEKAEKSSDMKNKVSEHETNIGWEEECMDYEQPFDLLNVHNKSVYESLIEKMSSCSLDFNVRIEKGNPNNLKILCMIGREFIANAYINLDSPMNVMILAYYKIVRSQGYEYRGLNFVRIRIDMHLFVENMSYVMDFTILENVKANIDPSSSQVVLSKPFVETTKLILDNKKGLITFTDEIREVTFNTPYQDSEIHDLTSE
uniref:Protein kinase-like domain, concanavalin A-like lectin/glucanase domain protein n=1 Tax=Tanacetum cinerariifolium TaxID=118510 RepID=A0A6L2NGK0_TANCI|nr:protein kinase-like domain, concanavalin A-like lectin/glucanase domain protein [Tanacetum cinerariifolium]